MSSQELMLNNVLGGFFGGIGIIVAGKSMGHFPQSFNRNISMMGNDSAIVDV